MTAEVPAAVPGRPAALRPLAVVLALLAYAAASSFLGLAGWRAGGLVIALPLTGIVIAGSWWAAYGEAGGRLWAAAGVVLSVTVAGVLVAHAPPSSRRMAQDLDKITFPFFVRQSQTTSGHGWCRPSCPALERTYRGPQNNDRVLMLKVAGALNQHGLISSTALAGLAARGDTTVAISARKYDLRVSVRNRTVVIRMQATRT